AVGCKGGSATYVIAGSTTDGVAQTRKGSLSEDQGQPGSYTGQAAPLYPIHGTASISITIDCPNGPDHSIHFDIYIDPSGHVVNQHGKPVKGAIVTLMHSKGTKKGPFVKVPNGSSIMSAANRKDPQKTGANG